MLLNVVKMMDGITDAIWKLNQSEKLTKIIAILSFNYTRVFCQKKFIVKSLLSFAGGLNSC